ncbi:MAG TPA: V-type ATPase subunit [Atribacterota bacterium]|nr:V-type ATPase subunit [Atribacterota bacterium]
MDRVIVYSAINTKIRILERGFLSRQDYSNMLQMTSVSQVASYLKENTSYRDILASIQTDKVSRRDIEDTLTTNMIINMDKLIYYFRGDYKVLIRSLYLKYEIEDLKILARSIFNGKKAEEIESSLSFLGKYSKIEPERLFQAETIRDLIYSLKGSQFFEFLIPLVDGRRENLFRFEMALDTGYFNIIQSRKLNILSLDEYLIKKWEGLLADLYNIQWIYRGKKFYQLSPEELLNYTINFGDRLHYKERQRLCYSKSPADLHQMTSGLVYGFLFKKEEISTDIYMERRINRFLFYKLKILNKKFPLTIIQTITYIWRLEMEIRDIISIVESIRYNIPAEEIKKYLVRAA